MKPHELSEMLQYRTALMIDEFKDLARSVLVSPPRVLNFQVNDICNAKCVMCNIWMRKLERELSPMELSDLLIDPFFAQVEHVGITGGEPTIRKDLKEFYDVLLKTLPRLVGASFITNGFLSYRAIETYRAIHQSYLQRGRQFGGMVSIDGVDAVHDRVRGKRNSFERATATLFGLREVGVPAIACCTIVRENVYHLHELLDWARTHNIYIRFRVGEFINRLYNADMGEQIRNFDSAERRHLVAFFHLLLTEYETDPQIRKTYTSILSLLTDGQRLIGCPYQSSYAINIDSQGRYAYCAPKGIPHTLDDNPTLALARHTLERVTIRQNFCPNCIHDYHADWTPRQRRVEETVHLREAQLYGIGSEQFPLSELPASPVNLTSLKHILLVGWYGTETAGDAAILAGIILEYRRHNPDLAFTIFSLFPYYTRVTLADLDADIAKRVDVVSYHGDQAWKMLHRCDAIVMAGGPLMDIPQTAMIAALFYHTAQQGKPRIIEGCGVGPLHQAEFRQNVIHVARLASIIRVRDTASQQLLRSYGIHKEIMVRVDPSHEYIQHTSIRHQGGSRVIRCFLRELTSEYPQAITPSRATEQIKHFLERLLTWYPEHHIELLAMHYFPVGNDDRRYAQQLANLLANERLSVDWQPRTPLEILSAMASADLCICMRFHSVVFAATIGAPFIAIDYTAGGKIRGFLNDQGRLNAQVTLDQLGDLNHDSLLHMVQASLAPVVQSDSR